MAQCFAAISSDGAIVVDTVSRTDRAAMVNWLIVHGGFMVSNGMGDFAIREHFDRLGKASGVRVEKCVVSRAAIEECS